MAEIISIGDKRLLSGKEKAERVKKRKLHAVQKVIQCMHCRMKCEKCGTHADSAQRGEMDEEMRLRVPYRFCLDCAEEYIDYIERLKGRGDPDCYWHNAVWMKSWHAWIEYKSALDQHTQSKEFLQLLKDLEDSDR